MSHHDEPPSSDDLQLSKRRDVLLIPALLATCLGGALLGLSALSMTIGQLLARSFDLPAGVTYLPPSSSDRAINIVRELAPLVVGVGLLILTWRYRARGRVWATWLCAVAAVLVSVVATPFMANPLQG